MQNRKKIRLHEINHFNHFKCLFSLSLLTACFTLVPPNLSLALRRFTNFAHPPLIASLSWVPQLLTHDMTTISQSSYLTRYLHLWFIFLHYSLTSSNSNPIGSTSVSAIMSASTSSFPQLLISSCSRGIFLRSTSSPPTGLTPGILSVYQPLRKLSDRLILKIRMETPGSSCFPNKDKDPYTIQGPP